MTKKEILNALLKNWNSIRRGIVSFKFKVITLSVIFSVMLIIVILTVTLGASILKQKHHEEIQRIITNRNGTVLQIDKVKLEDTPFLDTSPGNTIYKIVYEVEGIKHTAWYRGLNTINNIHSKAPKDKEEKWIFE